jgi:5-dehydro-2-deoxygluconokinase
MEELYILPFDHRGSFMKMFGVAEGSATPEQVAMLADYKHVVYEAFVKSLGMGVPQNRAAILVDEQFGSKIQEEARAAGYTRILTTEKSGQDEFDFEYGEAFGDHINRFKPEYVKVLVRYNPAGDAGANQRQSERLKRMNDFCKSSGYKLLFELLAVPTPAQLEAHGGLQSEYDTKTRWQTMRDAIAELQSRGIEPDIWKLEGLEDFEQMKAVIAQTQAGGRTEVGVVVLGRGESEEKVRVWLSVSAKIPGVVGFAVGRTVFKQPLMDLRDKKISREEASQKIAENFKGFVDLFEAAQKS